MLQTGRIARRVSWGKIAEIRGMLQTGRIEQRVSWGKTAEIRGMHQTGRIEQRVSWGKTAENQENAPNQKNCTKSGLEQNNRKSSKCSKPEELNKE